MLGIIKDGRFKEADKRKILIFNGENGRKISVVNPKEVHFLKAGYKEVKFINEKPNTLENQYTDVIYLDKGDYIEAEYVVKNFDESEGGYE